MIRTVRQVARRGGREWRWLREGSNPLRFQGGVAAPFIKRSRSLAAQTGWLVNSNKKKERYADINKDATRPFSNHPVCAAKERDLFIEAQPPLLENGGEWPRFNSCHRFRNCLARAPHFATCRTVLITNQFSIFIRTFEGDV